MIHFKSRIHNQIELHRPGGLEKTGKKSKNLINIFLVQDRIEILERNNDNFSMSRLDIVSKNKNFLGANIF